MRNSLLLPVLLALSLAGGGCVDVDVGSKKSKPREQEPATPEAQQSQAAAPDSAATAASRPGVVGGPAAAVSLGGSGIGGALSALESGNGNLTGILADIGRIATGITLGSEQGAIFHGYDALALPGQPVDLTARLRRAETLGAVAGARVGFSLLEEGQERPLGEAVTGPNGLASVPFTPPAAGDHVILARVLATAEEKDQAMKNLSPARLVVAARPAEARIAVVDLDHTVVASSFHLVLLGTATPMEGSAEVMKRLASERTIVYLTHRPDLLSLRSKKWLMDHGYPDGPVLMGDVEGLLAGSGQFKSALLAKLREVYPNVELGIGDKLSDAAGYHQQGIQAYLIPHYDEDPKEMRQLAEEIRQLPPGVQVVRNWQEVEQGIFQAKRYEPGAFARWLEQQAAPLERRQREQKDEDDD